MTSPVSPRDSGAPSAPTASARRAGRPAAQADPTATRERILEASAEVFARAGFEGASTRELATAAGVNISTLAWHFGDKQGLYEAVIDRTYERLLAVRLDLPTGTSGERVRTLVGRLYRAARGERVAVRMLLRHVLDTERLPAHVTDKWLGRVLTRVGELLSSLELPPGDHRLALLSVNHLLARYAVSDDADLVRFVSPAAGESLDDAVARHLGQAACALVGV